MHQTHRAGVPLAAIVLLTAAACAGGGSAPSPAGGDASPAASPSARSSASEPAASPSEPTSSVDPSVVPEAVLRPILLDAAARAGVDPADLTVAHAAAVEFNDGSLGCPEPGMVYTQAIVPGWQVILEHGGERIDYRASGPGAFRVCPDGGAPLPGDY